MPCYFFHIREGDQFMIDEKGMDFPSFEAALEQARQNARELISQRILATQKVYGMKLDIADENGTVIKTLTVRDYFM